MIEIRKDIKMLYRLNCFIIVLVMAVAIIEVPNFRDMVDKKLQEVDNYIYATRQIGLIRQELDDIKKDMYKSKIVTIYERFNQF